MNKQMLKTIALALTIGSLTSANLNAESDLLSYQDIPSGRPSVTLPTTIMSGPPSVTVVSTVMAGSMVALVTIPYAGYALGKKITQYIKKSQYLKAAGVYGLTLASAFTMDAINDNLLVGSKSPAALFAGSTLGGLSLWFKTIPTIMAMKQSFKKVLKIKDEEIVASPAQ